MKRLLLLLLIFSASFSFGQNTVHTYKNQIGTWNEYSQKWDLGKFNLANINFTFTANIVTCDNKSMSVYRLKINTKKNIETELTKGSSWDCIDERNRKCMFLIQISRVSDVVVYTISYDDKMFRYYVGESDGLSTFN